MGKLTVDALCDSKCHQNINFISSTRKIDSKLEMPSAHAKLTYDIMLRVSSDSIVSGVRGNGGGRWSAY